MEPQNTTPFHEPDQQSDSRGNHRADGSPDGPVTVLIVEDSVTQALALRYLLEQQHCEVLAAVNGKEAMACLRGRHPTLIIADINMPEMDGYELCHQIRNDELLSDLPIILLTSLSDPKDVLRGIECGADSFVVKPYDDRVLLSRIENVLAHPPARRRAQPSAPTEIVHDGQSYTIHTDQTNTVELLLSTYEVAVQKNRQLAEAREQLMEQADELKKALAEATESHAQLLRAQMQLIEAEKLLSVGQLAAGIAHEVKNPLAILQLGTQWLSESALAGEGQASLVLNEMKDAVERASLVIGDLLHFSSQSALEIGQASINALIEKTLRFVKHDLATAKVRVVKLLAADLPNCRVDANKILQVFINLFVNASHAMPHGGVLTITTSKRVMDADDADYAASGSSGPRYRARDTVVVVEIHDTGMGIAEEHLQKIFDPFFTTKPAGQGTGLGLPVTKQIVDLHEGLLSIRNAGEGGVVVTITFTRTAPED